MRGTRGIIGVLAVLLVFAAAGGCGGKKPEPAPPDRQTTDQGTGGQPASDAGGGSTTDAGPQTIDNFTGNVQDQAGNPVGRGGDGGEGESGREGPESGRESGTERR